MKKYSVLRRIWDNVEMTVGLSLAMMVVREIKQGRFYPGNSLDTLMEDFGGILLLVGILVTTFQLMYGYYAIEGQKITFGYTRKRCFLEMQEVKLISTAVIFVIHILFNLRQMNFEYGKKIILELWGSLSDAPVRRGTGIRFSDEKYMVFHDNLTTVSAFMGICSRIRSAKHYKRRKRRRLFFRRNF